MLSKAAFTQLPPSNLDVRIYYYSELQTTFADGSVSQYTCVLVSALDMGRVAAVAVTNDAIHRWQPLYVLLVGIAGGMQERAALGDVIVASLVVDYELQKIMPDRNENRYIPHPIDRRLFFAAQSMALQKWRDLICTKRPLEGQAEQLIGLVATGDKVIADSKTLKRLQDTWPKLVGVEMEAGGVATACSHAASRPGFFMVRGVSDLADSNKGTKQVEDWRGYACDVAASFAIALLQNGPLLTSELQQRPASRLPVADRLKRIVEELTQLARLQHQAAWSLPRIADILGYPSVGQLEALLNATQEATFAQLEHIAKTFWINVDWLKYGDGEPYAHDTVVREPHHVIDYILEQRFGRRTTLYAVTCNDEDGNTVFAISPDGLRYKVISSPSYHLSRHNGQTGRGQLQALALITALFWYEGTLRRLPRLCGILVDRANFMALSVGKVHPGLVLAQPKYFSRWVDEFHDLYSNKSEFGVGFSEAQNGVREDLIARERSHIAFDDEASLDAYWRVEIHEFIKTCGEDRFFDLPSD